MGFHEYNFSISLLPLRALWVMRKAEPEIPKKELVWIGCKFPITRYVVLTAVFLKRQSFWEITPCRLVTIYQSSRRNVPVGLNLHVLEHTFYYYGKAKPWDTVRLLHDEIADVHSPIKGNLSLPIPLTTRHVRMPLHFSWCDRTGRILPCQPETIFRLLLLTAMEGMRKMQLEEPHLNFYSSTAFSHLNRSLCRRYILGYFINRLEF